jgi:hypothetical protein
VEHWPAAYFPEAGIPIVRGWYRQNDFPANELLYDEQVGPRAYQEWLRSLGVRYVVLAAAPADYSARAEAALLRSGASGLLPVFRTGTLTVYELRDATPVISGRSWAEVRATSETKLFIQVGAAGRYRVAVRYSPYWRASHGCVVRARDGMTTLTVNRPATIVLSFDMNIHRSIEALTGARPEPFCRA